MSDRNTWWPKLQVAMSMLLMAAVILPVFLSEHPWPESARDYLMTFAVAESGALNLVSAIYLGYRAFDTLGETIVLLVAVTGTMALLSRVESLVSSGVEKESSLHTSSGFTLSKEKRSSHALRTHLLEEVTGKVGPIVLLFGFYVMLYGHLSPGGGFQGGVIIASGIVFLALGNPYGGTSALSRPNILSAIEHTSFFLFVLAAISGVFLGRGFFGNPLTDTPVPVGFIIIMNSLIGMKVGASIAFMCIAMMGRGSHD